MVVPACWTRQFVAPALLAGIDPPSPINARPDRAWLAAVNEVTPQPGLGSFPNENIRLDPKR